MERKNIASGTPWEKIVGYSRAVRVGNMVEVSGTVAIDEKGMVVGETAYEQTVFILKKYKKHSNKPTHASKMWSEPVFLWSTSALGKKLARLTANFLPKYAPLQQW